MFQYCTLGRMGAWGDMDNALQHALMFLLLLPWFLHFYLWEQFSAIFYVVLNILSILKRLKSHSLTHTHTVIQKAASGTSSLSSE